MGGRERELNGGHKQQREKDKIKKEGRRKFKAN